MSNSSVAGIILAAGQGTRMRSELPKCLHSVCGQPMVEHIARAMKACGVSRPVIVIGHGGDLLKQALGDSYDYAWQTEQLGTGHAVLMAKDFIAQHRGPVLITPGDTPLLNGQLLQSLLQKHTSSEAACTVATVTMPDPKGYGRIVRDPMGGVSRIVEDRDASPEEKEIREINTAVYVFEAEALLEVLPGLSNSNAQGEYYLTDALSAIYAKGHLVQAALFDDADAFQGVNDRWQLAQADGALRQRVLRAHAVSGVTIVDPLSTFIGIDVSIGCDTVVHPFTVIEGSTVIGAECEIGPNSKIQDSSIGDGCTVLMSHLNESTMLAGSRCGPFANLRPGSVLGEKAKVGNFVEIKNARLGSSVAVSHLSYIGDGTVGDRTNIGAGTIFCNYDGFSKHRTDIGDDVFVGSNSTIIAPLTIGDGAFVAAGSVINQNVPENALAIGRGRQEVKEEWAAQWRIRKKRTGNKE